MKRFSYCNPQSNKTSLFKKNKFFVYNIYFNLILQNKTILTTDILPDGEVPNDFWNGSLLEGFRFDPEFHTVLAPPTQKNTVSSFKEYFSKKKVTIFLHDEIQWHGDKEMIKSIVLQQDIFIATDGLAKTNTATFSWILSTITGLRLLSNIGLSNGHNCYSYCAEAMAIVSIFIFYNTTIYMIINKILLK